MIVRSVTHHKDFRDGTSWTITLDDHGERVSVEARGLTREEAIDDAVATALNRHRPSPAARAAMQRNSAAIQRAFHPT